MKSQNAKVIHVNFILSKGQAIGSCQRKKWLYYLRSSTWNCNMEYYLQLLQSLEK